MNAPKPDELEKAIDDIGYAILQACVAHDLYHIEVIPALKKIGISEETIAIINNASLESQLLFLRKLNEFFKPLPAKEEDDLRAEQYYGFKSSGPFLSGSEVKEINKGVGHMTLKGVREGKKDWSGLVRGSVPVAIDRSLEFFRFLRESAQLSSSHREDAQYYIDRLERMKRLLNHQPVSTAGGLPRDLS